MSPDQFEHWRAVMGFTQAQAAEALGYGKRRIEQFGKGEGSPIPLHVDLACAALYRRLTPFSEGAQFTE